MGACCSRQAHRPSLSLLSAPPPLPPLLSSRCCRGKQSQKKRRSSAGRKFTCLFFHGHGSSRNLKKQSLTHLACGTCPAPAMAGLPPTLLARESTGAPEADEPYPVQHAGNTQATRRRRPVSEKRNKRKRRKIYASRRARVRGGCARGKVCLFMRDTRGVLNAACTIN